VRIEAVRQTPEQVPVPTSQTFVGSFTVNVKIGQLVRKRRVNGLIGVVAILVAIGIVVVFQLEFIISIAILISGLYGMAKLWRLSNADAKAFVEAYQLAMKDYASRVEEWNRIKALPTKFTETKQKLVAAKSMFTDLPALRTRKLAELNATRRQRQLQHFVESHRIEDAVLSGIGKGRKELLRAYNVEDAYDVAPSTISNIKGFGPTMWATLLAWRSSLD
jgi:DNA-binding helix-hairpin-helix protein with protein kinase domain